MSYRTDTTVFEVTPGWLPPGFTKGEMVWLDKSRGGLYPRLNYRKVKNLESGIYPVPRETYRSLGMFDG